MWLVTPQAVACPYSFASLLHPSRLAQRSTAWRKDYAAWRGGKASGARGELEAIRTPRASEELNLGTRGDAGGVGHSRHCGDVQFASPASTRAAGSVLP